MINTRQNEQNETNGDRAPSIVDFPEAAHFVVGTGPADRAPETVIVTIEAASDVAVGESIVESARVGGGILLRRRQRWQPH